MSNSNSTNPLARHSDLLMAIGMMSVLFVLVVPLHPFVLDLAITVNLSLGLMVLLITLSVGEPLDFNTFPSLLLFTTLLRLALNVASTRLILLNGQAGKVIQAFGDFVVGGNLVVGLVIFVILITIQFVVITKGSNRISEVAARFTLDAMPGKQMAIDADLNAGLLTEEEARDRRQAITTEAEFYGAMDGAGKFVRGDAIAGLIITLVNIIGGVAIGMGNDLAIGEALRKYAILTVGDGLISQIPALVIAIAAGTLVTKTKSEKRLASEIVNQFTRVPSAVRMAGGVTIALGLVPGLPLVPFGILGVSLLILASRAATWNARAEKAPALGSEPETEESGELTAEALQDILRVDRLAVEIGYRLIPLVDSESKGGLLDHIQLLRRQFAQRFGFVVPPIRMRDNLSLEASAYRVLLSGEEIGKGEIHPDRLLAMNPGLATEPVDGIKTTDPTFGLEATWVAQEDRNRAEMMGYTVIEPDAVLVTHLTELIKEHAHELISREDVQAALDRVRADNPVVVSELVPDVMGVGTIQKILSNLLVERIPILNMPAILEALADEGRQTKETGALTEAVRQRLARLICETHANMEGRVAALSLDGQLEQRLSDALTGASDAMLELSPTLLRTVQEEVVRAWQDAQMRGQEPVLVVRPQLRRHMAELFRNLKPPIPVLSLNEIIAAKGVESAGLVHVDMSQPAHPQEQEAMV